MDRELIRLICPRPSDFSRRSLAAVNENGQDDRRGYDDGDPVFQCGESVNDGCDHDRVREVRGCVGDGCVGDGYVDDGRVGEIRCYVPDGDACEVRGRDGDGV